MRQARSPALAPPRKGLGTWRLGLRLPPLVTNLREAGLRKQEDFHGLGKALETGLTEGNGSPIGAVLFLEVLQEGLLLPLRDDAALRSLVALQRLQRAIGVIYRPDTERQSHYAYTHLAQQFDALIHIDETSAVEPLDLGQVWTGSEAPETFPSGI